MDALRTIQHETTPRRPPTPTAFSEPRPRDAAPEFLRAECSLCDAPFVLDVEEHCGREPAEMEVIGRQFLSVSRDALLCQRCLHEVETAGAERMYWARAGR